MTTQSVKVPRHLLTDWDRENPEFWESRGRCIIRDETPFDTEVEQPPRPEQEA